MAADAEHGRWVAFGAQNSIGINTMSNSIQESWYSSVGKVSADSSANLYVATGFDDAIPPQLDITPVKAVNKVNRSENQSYTVGLATITGSYSTGESCIDMDYLDLNGDRYPDIVGTHFVQYRSQWGGLGDLAPLPHDINSVTSSTTNSAAVSYRAFLYCNGTKGNGRFNWDSD